MIRISDQKLAEWADRLYQCGAQLRLEAERNLNSPEVAPLRACATEAQALAAFLEHARATYSMQGDRLTQQWQQVERYAQPRWLPLAWLRHLEMEAEPLDLEGLHERLRRVVDGVVPGHATLLDESKAVLPDWMVKAAVAADGRLDGSLDAADPTYGQTEAACQQDGDVS